MNDICPMLHYRCPEDDRVPDEPPAGCELDQGHEGLHLCMDCGTSWAGNDLLNAAAAAAREASNRAYRVAVQLNPSDIVVAEPPPFAGAYLYRSRLDQAVGLMDLWGDAMAWPVLENFALQPGEYRVVDRVTHVPIDAYDYIRTEEAALGRARAEKLAGHPISDRP